MVCHGLCFSNHGAKCVQAKINMDEGWHNALHRDCHFGGRKGLPLANVEVSICQGFFNYAVITNDNVPVSHSRPDPVTDAYGNDQEPQMKKKRILHQDNRVEVLACMAMAVQSMGGWSPLMVAVSAMPEQFSPPPTNPSPLQCAIAFSLRRTLPKPTPCMNNLDVDELVALAERLGVQFTLRVCYEDKWHTILAPLAVDHKTHVTIQFGDDHYRSVKVVQTEHDASPMAIDPETHDTVSIHHHSPLPPVHEVDPSVHDTSSQIVTRLALCNDSDSTHPMNTIDQTALESLGTKYATVGHGVDVRSSRLKGGGQGLFASQPYKKNDTITFMVGTLLCYTTCKDWQGHRRAYLRTLIRQDMVLDGIPCKDLTERQGATSAANDANPYNRFVYLLPSAMWLLGRRSLCLMARLIGNKVV